MAPIGQSATAGLNFTASPETASRIFSKIGLLFGRTRRADAKEPTDFGVPVRTLTAGCNIFVDQTFGRRRIRATLIDPRRFFVDLQKETTSCKEIAIFAAITLLVDWSRRPLTDLLS
ncbi:MAG: hypothetical protein ABS79_04615 [Planctomycetes bacterium SCN 63-9]|nr:MAG: hypothetical protein ABS79_04615 [Planctomycetes bacterium SCN 63-9]